MSGALRAPPWRNLWRHLVTTLLFTLAVALLVGAPIEVATGYDFTESGSLGWWFTIGVAYVLAAVVVWSDVPWPGDPG